MRLAEGGQPEVADLVQRALLDLVGLLACTLNGMRRTGGFKTRKLHRI